MFLRALFGGQGEQACESCPKSKVGSSSPSSTTGQFSCAPPPSTNSAGGAWVVREKEDGKSVVTIFFSLLGGVHCIPAPLAALPFSAGGASPSLCLPIMLRPYFTSTCSSGAACSKWSSPPSDGFRLSFSGRNLPELKQSAVQRLEIDSVPLAICSWQISAAGFKIC